MDVVALQAAKASAARTAQIGPGVLLTNPKGLRRWSAALSDAVLGQAVINVPGDSISFGNGSDGQANGTPNSVALTSGYVAQLRSLFAATYGDPGEGGILANDSRVVLAAGATIHASTGPQEQMIRLNAAGQTATLSLPQCTQIDVYAWDGGNGTVTYSVDGAAAVNLSGGSGNVNALTWNKTSITGLSDATHSLVLTGAAASTIYAHVVVTRKRAGVLVNRYGVPGNTSANLVAKDGSNSSNSAAQQRVPLANVLLPKADLVIVPLGVNDFGNQNSLTATLGQPGTIPDGYEANLRSFASVAIAQGACVLLVGEPRQNAANYPAPATYVEADYYARMRKVAQDTDHVSFLDVGDLWGTNVQGQALSFYTTASVHPTRRGHGSIARLIHRALTMPLGQNAAAS